MTIEAIDVSWFNGTISWPRVPQPLAIIRATNGLDVTVEGLNASVDINYAANGRGEARRKQQCTVHLNCLSSVLRDESRTFNSTGRPPCS